MLLPDFFLDTLGLDSGTAKKLLILLLPLLFIEKLFKRRVQGEWQGPTHSDHHRSPPEHLRGWRAQPTNQPLLVLLKIVPFLLFTVLYICLL